MASNNNPSAPMRVPPNTHPSQYGTVDNTQDNSYYYSAFGDSYNTSAGSLRDQLASFATSSSRTSALYMAENLSLITSRVVAQDLNDDHIESQLDDSKSRLLPIDYTLTQTLSQQPDYHVFPSLSRHTTVASIISQQFHQTDPHHSISCSKSTFLQSVFNSINVLVGIGVLAFPLAFRCAGWMFGSLIFFFCTFATNYTAKVIAKCLDFYPHSSTYGDMGAMAFGDRGRAFVSTVFVVELMTIGVALVVLLGDSIESLFPGTDILSIRIFSFVVLTPMLFLPISKLAYTSLIGIISCFCLVTIVLYDGLSKRTKPGSLIQPMETELIPSQLYYVPLSFGLMMSGFSGHAVFPAIYRDMEDPKQYNRMVDLTYFMTVGIYITMAVAGYTMFGLETMQEITQNLATTPGYMTWMNRLAVWLIVLTPLAKYGLMMSPVSITWELWITSYKRIESWCQYHVWRKSLLVATGKILASGIVILVATVFPGFDRVMSLLGALFSFAISAIFPLICYLRLFDTSVKETVLIYFILLVSAAMAVSGTIWSFLPNDL